MRVLITGGAGFIGRHLATTLARRGDRVTVLDLAPPAADPGVVHCQGSVLDAARVDVLVGGADLVVHLAAIAEPARYGSDPLGTLDVTLSGSLNVVRSCADLDVPVLFASTSEVYGMNPDLPWSEDARRVLGPVSNTRWCYASAKATVEHYLEACRLQRGLRYAVVRLFNVYGPRLRGRVVDTFVRRALEGQALEVHDDGTQTRSFCYVSDVVGALAALSGAELSGRTYNVGSAEPTRIIDLAREVIRLAGSPSEVVFKPYASLYTGFEDVPRRQPDIARITRELGWRPVVPLSEGLALTLAAFRAERLAGGGARAG